MVYLNYNNLDAATQEQLFCKSKIEVEQSYGKDLKAYAIENGLDYDTLLEEEAIKHLYSYTYIFHL